MTPLPCDSGDTTINTSSGRALRLVADAEVSARDKGDVPGGQRRHRRVRRGRSLPLPGHVTYASARGSNGLEGGPRGVKPVAAPAETVLFFIFILFILTYLSIYCPDERIFPPLFSFVDIHPCVEVENRVRARRLIRSMNLDAEGIGAQQVT